MTVGAVLTAACSSAPRGAREEAALVTEPIAAAPPAPTTTAAPAPETVAPAVEVPEPTTTVPPPAERAVTDPGWSPFASVAGITLVHPSSAVERIGFHQSNHEGAQQLDRADTAVAPVTLEARERLTRDRTAADVVVDPASQIRAPVTGVVKRAGSYVLYCEHRDYYVVIAPDANPAWEVKILHIAGLTVSRGQRVVAGQTVIAPNATQLPFESQVNEHTAVPAWPHVHIEVVDPAIRNIPSPGGGC